MPSCIQLACTGAVVAASFIIDKILDLNKADSLLSDSGHLTDVINGTGNVCTRLEATVAVAVISGLVIPVGILMTFIHLCNADLSGSCGRVIAATVSYYSLRKLVDLITEILESVAIAIAIICQPYNAIVILHILSVY